MLNRRTLLNWLLASLPLLLALGWTFLAFNSEADVYRFMLQHRAAHPDLKAAAKLVTNWGNAVMYPIYAWLLITGLRRGDRGRVRLAVVYIIVQLVISLALVNILKYLIGRPRPDVEGLFRSMSSRAGYHSMPSGHTTEISGAVLPLAIRARSTAAALGMGLYVGMVAYSRVYLGWHHPSDVACGWMLGSVAALAIHLFSHEDRT